MECQANLDEHEVPLQKKKKKIETKLNRRVNLISRHAIPHQ
jgi:hypothetical protein